MIPVTPRGKGNRGRDRDRGASRVHRTIHRKWKGSFQTFGKEVCITGHSVSPSLRTVLQEYMCCQCYSRFGGHLPVPRADALLPYWVPLSLRPRKQVSKMIRRYIPRAIRSCRCPCHSFGGCLPMPKDRAVMPYWVPQGLRSQKKVVKRLENVKDTPECSLESSSWHGCWRVCGDQHLLLKWQQLQALHQDELPGSQEDKPHAGRLGLFLPMSFNLFTLLQAVLRAILAIRHLFWD
ncbi:uncharacterized protein C16orf95 homolog isoform X1 [Mesocricetus auratus]|uniref:Uncharacterized protein C16orf95 homolog isoform X1 n=2 Tax=Mesocricetus auratus TaxID=10036 RepID=A0ABM2WSA5_MESAU|nr:uncharacterized protein C16orf95 homolog isoform X1 [Mesocricetus auratus]